MPANGKDMFCCHAQTDGFSTYLLFARPRKGKCSETKLELVDFNENEFEKYFQQIALDPGWKQVFAAVTDYENDCNQTRRHSSGERKCYAGSYYSQKYVNRLNIEKSIKVIETSLTSAKTTFQDIYKDYLGKTHEELNHLLNSTDWSLHLSDSIIIKGVRE